MLAGGVRCARCGLPIEPGEPWDLGHVDGDKSRYAGPEHRACNRATASKTRQQLFAPPAAELEPERDGLAWTDPRWKVPWLRGLRRPPADASWPRLMTVPHRRAVGSLGPAFIEWAEARSERPLRWWQRLAATRILEVDVDGRLVWETVLLSLPRQLGKSWLLRELCFWRIHERERFGEPQDVLHTGKDLRICLEVQRPARIWAKARPEYRVREANGQVEIELLEAGSRWMLFAQEAVYGFSVSLAAADEAWKVRPEVIEEGVEPTMVEREQPQLLLVSTAHRKATSLMLGRRAVAIDELEAGEGVLLIEWSSTGDAELDDVSAWRQASSQWSARRERTIRAQLDAALAGTLRAEDEPDPVESFKAQWLNIWPRRLAEPDGKTEPLLPAGMWAGLAEAGLSSDGPVWVAVEDLFGRAAATAAARRLDDGRLEVEAWRFDDWDDAVSWVESVTDTHTVRQLLVGASMLDAIPAGMAPPPQRRGGTETRAGLALLRDLALGGQVVHDVSTYDLDEALSTAQVKEASTGLILVQSDTSHVVKAAVWALQAAHRPAPVPAVA